MTIRPLNPLSILLTLTAALTLAPATLAASTDFDPSTGAITDARWPSGVPLGGIGTGKIEVLTDGSFGNVTINHNWDRPYGWAKGAFAAIHVQSGTQAPVTKMLRLGTSGEYDGIDNIQHVRMTGWFPRAHFDFTDPDLPVKVRMDAFSPLIPHDVKDSSLPIACLTYTLTNPGAQTVHASLALAWPNLLGWGGRLNAGSSRLPGQGNEEWDSLAGDTQSPAVIGSLSGLRYTTSQSYTDTHQQVVGEYYVSARSEPGLSVSTCPSWDAAAATPNFWRSFSTTGDIANAADTASDPAQPAGAVAAACDLAPGQSRTVRFYITWAMPHQIAARLRNVFVPLTPSMTVDDRWTTNNPAHPGDSIVVDLTQSETPTRIVLDQGKYSGDYPRGLTVETSDDGQVWHQNTEIGLDAIRSQLNGGATITIQLTPISCRYLRLTNLGSDEYHQWSIHHLSIALQGMDAPLAFAPSDVPVLQDNGHYWQNWWTDAPGIAAYVDAHSDRLLGATKAWQAPVMASNLPFWLKLKLINCAFPMVTNTVLTKDGRFAVQESPVDMGGALGTMDQRMASHAFLTAFFPELDQSELELFADCQRPDGRITHFDGNVHNAVGSPDVNYGITNWPDLSCSWVMQTAKLYRWTGNTAFLSRMMPHVTAAMEFLNSADHAHDGIPEGGSTYDYEGPPPGSFTYTAICYLGALRAAASLSDAMQAQAYNRRFRQTQRSTMTELWNGTRFLKWYAPSTGESNGNSFVASLAGDWLTHLSGLPSALPPGIARKEVAQIVARHQRPFFPVPPMEVYPDGKSATGTCYFLQHEPYLGCEAIYQNYVDDGLETIRRVYLSVWEINRNPWAEPLAYNAPHGRSVWGATYMTSPATWHVLNALGGTSLDLPAHRMYISPRLTTTQAELHEPVYFSRFWGWLDYAPLRHCLTLRVTHVFPASRDADAPLYHAPGAPGDAEPSAMTITSVAADGDSKPIKLAHPFTVAIGETLDLSSEMTRLDLPRRSHLANASVTAKNRVR